MKKINASLIIGFVLSVIFSGIFSFNADYSHLQNNVLRLHIIANSDSDADQNLKLEIRDRILAHSDEFFPECENIHQAEMSISENLDKITAIAQQTINENGFSYSADAEIVDMHFDSKVYDDITMPAGNYKALRITLGKAEGHNWWCVMYPPLCVQVDGVTGEYFTDGEQDILYNPENYEIRFKCVEIFNEIFSE